MTQPQAAEQAARDRERVLESLTPEEIQRVVRMAAERRRNLWIVAVRFKRSSTARWEEGVAIGQHPGSSDFETIVDLNGRPVTDPWDFRLYASTLAVTLTEEGE